MRKWMCALAAATLAAGASPAHAQEADGFQRPATSLSLGFFDGAQVAVGRRISAATDVGLALAAAGSRLHTDAADPSSQPDLRDHAWGLTLEPWIKHYMGSGGALLPYSYASVLLTHGQTRTDLEGDDVTRLRTTGVGGSVGLGADWFVAPRVSVGGRVVVAGGYATAKSTSSAPTTATQHGWFLGTGQSGVQLTFHF